jgi:hypothetical protein
MLSLRSAAALLGVVAVVGACTARPPSGPNVWVLPGEGKDQARFRQEDGACRQYALGQIGQGSPQQAGAASASTRTLQQRYDVAYAQCMAASGNRLAGPEDGLTADHAPYPFGPYAYYIPHNYRYDPTLGGWRRRQYHLGHRSHWGGHRYHSSGRHHGGGHRR